MQSATPRHTGFAQSSVNFVITATLVIGGLVLIGVDVTDPSMLPLLGVPLLGVGLFALSYLLPHASVWRRAVRFLAWGLVLFDVLLLVAFMIVMMILMSQK